MALMGLNAEFSIELAPQPMPKGGAMAGLSDLVAQLSELQAPAVRRAPENPCYNDIKRFRCSDAACLRRSAEDLSPECAAFLLDEPIPSPAPVARMPRGGTFTVVTSDETGTVMQTSGRLSGAPFDLIRGSMMGGASPSLMMPAALAMMIPPEIAAILTGEADVVKADDEREVAEERGAMHPCAQEIEACARETHSDQRAPLEACLVKHYSQLSAECKCFVHHVIGSPKDASTTSPPATAIAITRAIAPGQMVMDGETVVMMDGRPVHPAHRLSCLFLFAAIFAVSIMLARACVLSCCRSRPRTARTVIVVPPEQATIQAIDVPEAKVPSMATKTAPIQVAEPLRKA